MCCWLFCYLFFFFFFNDTATTEIYTLSLHDALPNCRTASAIRLRHRGGRGRPRRRDSGRCGLAGGGEELRRHGGIVAARPQDRPHGQRSCPLATSERRDEPHHADRGGEEADRHPQHGSAPAMLAEPAQQLPACANGWVEEVDDVWRVGKVTGAPCNRG